MERSLSLNPGYRSHGFCCTHPVLLAKLTHQSLMKNERRQNERLYHHAEVQIITKTYASITAYTINLSDGAMLLKFQYRINFKVGDILNIQSQIFPEAPIKKVIVRRVPDSEKIGVEFI